MCPRASVRNAHATRALGDACAKRSKSYLGLFISQDQIARSSQVCAVCWIGQVACATGEVKLKASLGGDHVLDRRSNEDALAA